jgi:hypothetical protein
MVVQNSAQCGAVAWGTRTPLSALNVKLLSKSRAITFRLALEQAAAYIAKKHLSFLNTSSANQAVAFCDEDADLYALVHIY